VLDDVTMSQASLVAELHQANPTAGMAALVSGALRVGRDHIAATVNTLFLAYAGAALPSLILFVTGQDSLGTVATTELVAVEVVRALCGSVGLIAAVPLTTVLAALVATEERSEVQARPRADGGRSPEARTDLQPGPLVKGPGGRSGWGALARGLGQEQAELVLDRVLAVHGAHLSHAMVDVDSGWLATEALPASARTAAARLRQLDADAQRGVSRYQRARTRGLARLDLSHPEELDLLRRYGPFTTDTRDGCMATRPRSSRPPTALATCPASPTASTQPSLNRSGPHSRRPGSPAPHLFRGGSAPASASIFLQVDTKHAFRPSAQLMPAQPLVLSHLPVCFTRHSPSPPSVHGHNG
jgi:hypothetical protein